MKTLDIWVNVNVSITYIAVTILVAPMWGHLADSMSCSDLHGDLLNQN